MKDSIEDLLFHLAESCAVSDKDRKEIELLNKYGELAKVASDLADRYGVDEDDTATLEGVNRAIAYFTAVVETLKEFKEMGI